MGTRHDAAALAQNDTGHDASDWVEAHEALSRLARQRAALDAEEGRWLLSALRSAAHAHLGFASFPQYIERLFGYKPRTTQEKLRVAEALETLPRLAGALEAGSLSWCAARELTRVAAPETEQAWLATARGKSQRELEALIANTTPGDPPGAGPAELPRPRVLHFEVTPDTYATFREATQRLRRTAGGHLDDDAVLLAMARHVLGGPPDAGRSNYQISLALCPSCGGGTQTADAELVPIDPAVIAMATCDAQHLGEVLPDSHPPSAPRAANENAAPGAHAHAGAELETTATGRCLDHAHVGAENPKPPQPNTPSTTTLAAGASRPRARQNIPPALRRAVLARDRHCRVPGCSHATFVDVHHIQPRAEGGRNDANNLLVLCSAHHRAVHRGELLIEPANGNALAFRHADATPYGDATVPQRIDAHTKVFSALRHLGFREGEAKAVLAELRADAALEGATVERLLREALCRIKAVVR